MIWSAFCGVLWVLAATGTAFLPMRRQFVPGVALLITAPVLIIWLGYEAGWLVAVLAVLAFASMFRNPLRYLIARVRGQNPTLPPEMYK